MISEPCFEIHDRVGSTMDVAREALLSGRIRLVAPGRFSRQGVIASEQTAGRGQRGRTWHSPCGDNLYVTFFYQRGGVTPSTAGHIALLAGAAAADALDFSCLLTLGIPPSNRTPLPQVGLKWPNDLLLNDRKVGGILTELVQIPDLGWVALIGMGVNLNQTQFPAELASIASSLRREGVPPSPPIQTASLISLKLDLLADRRMQIGFTTVLRRWIAHDRTPGRRYETLLEGNRVIGTAVGIDPEGRLLLRLDDGRVMSALSASSLQNGR